MTNQTRLRVDMISESEFTVQGHGVHTAFVEMTNALKARPDVDVVVNQSRPVADVMHVQTIGLFSARMLRRTKGKKVISGHVIPASLVGSIKGMGRLQWLARAYMRWFYNKADLVLVVSEGSKRELQSIGVTRPIHVLYNTIDTTKYHNSPALKQAARQKLGISPEAFVVIGSGQVQPRKRVDIFFEMAQRLPDVEFIWVGGTPFGAVGSENSAMQKMMKQAPKNLRFTGVIPLREIADYYRAADVFVLPSEQETFGLVVVEAAAAGLPVILRDIPDYDDTFRGDAVMASSDDGFLTLVQVLRQDTEARRNAQASAKRIAQRFDSKAGGEQLVAFYKDVMNL